VKTKPLTDDQRILLRKRTELQWRAKWRGHTHSIALLDLWRSLHRNGCVSLAAFKIFKKQNGFYDV